MNFRWLFGNFADPEFGLTRQQERAVTKLAHRKYLSRTKLALWTLVLVAVSYLFVGFGWEPLASLFFTLRIPSPRWSSLVFICGVVVVFAAWMYRYLYRKPILMALCELHYEVCVECGYRMQGLDDSVKQCPECGAAREQMSSNARRYAESPK